MTDKHHWEIARTVKTMGMKTTVVLDPQQITTRVKNNVKRMLRLGRVTGNGDAAKIADQIRKKFALPVTRDWWRGMHIETASTDTKRELLRLVEADWAAIVMENPGYLTHSYYKDRHREAVINLKSSTSCGFHLGFHDPAFYQQAAEAMAKSMTETDKKNIEDAILYLDGTTPIHITTYQ